MNKTALKNFAIYAREKLIKDIEGKARLIGISEEGIKSPLPESTKDMYAFDIGAIETHRIYGEDVKKYDRLVEELEKRKEESDYKTAYSTLVEEVAYTWFNRIIAIRFMEVNNYMPDKMRVLSSGKEGVREPEFVTNYRDTDIGITDEEFEVLDELKLDGSAKAMEELFQFMFIKQCNALNSNLPELFEEIDDYAELLLNISYEDPQGVVRKLVEDIGEEPFDISKTGQIEIIGWLYQYYNTVPKAEVDAAVKRNKKVDKNTIPAKTQLFTPEWIVKYMVQNSLGRLWIERKIAIGSDKTEEELAKDYGWKYYLPEAEQIQEVKVELKNIREVRKNLKLEDITFIDPSMGSGHILVYAFEMFMQFYLEEGYMEREAAESIIENNLYGLDIDKRAYQLACFSLMMKGRQYSRRILNKDIENNLYYFIDSRDINLKQIDLLGGNIEDTKTKDNIKQDLLEIVELFKDGRELGSIIKIGKKYNYDELLEYVANIDDENILPIEMIGIEDTQKSIIYLLRLARTLSKRYITAVTNPPYLANTDTKGSLKKYIDSKYRNTKRDLFAVFMEVSEYLLIENGYYGIINQHSWMFLSSYSNYREKFLLNNTIINLLHLGPRLFDTQDVGTLVQSVAFIAKNMNVDKYKSTYFRLTDFSDSEQKKNALISNTKKYITDKHNYSLIDNKPIAYWISENISNIFLQYKNIGYTYEVKQGMTTSDNKRFLRSWHEVENFNISFKCNGLIEAKYSQKRWFPYNKGGLSRKWFGNSDTLVNYKNDGEELKSFHRELNKTSSGGRLKNKEYYFKEAISWVYITDMNSFGARYIPNGFIFDVSGSSLFVDNEKKNYILGLLCSKISIVFMNILNPTMNFQVRDIKNIPIIFSETNKEEIDSLVQQNISISKTDWDSFETSWDFEVNPLLDIDKQGQLPRTIESAYENWKEYANNNFAKLKENEERLNELFIEIYGLKDELAPEVSDKDITIAKIFDDKKDIYDDIKGNQYILTKEDVIKSFISYGVGCIFGRYSLDEKGLIYAGGEFDINRYNKFRPVEDNIVLITDKEYFEDDLVNRFVEFVKLSFGQENIEVNLKFIADSLKGSGTPREKIRNYFVNDFYKDHVQMYKKTPIYWLYDSSAGKTKRQSQNGFKALVYMHRYDADTTGKVRIDYLHKVQRIYERRMDFLKDDIAHNKDARQVAESEKELEKIIKQVKECKDYDEKIGHIALSRIDIDLDYGVKVNYQKVQTDDNGKKFKILAKI